MPSTRAAVTKAGGETAGETGGMVARLSVVGVDVLRDLFLPTTDAGAAFQALIAVPVFAVALIAVRRSRDLLWFVSGLAVLTYAWFALRTVH